MNTVDLIFLVPLLLGLISGYRKGLINQLANLGGIVLAVLLSIKFGGDVAVYLSEKNIVGENWVKIVGFALTFLAVVIVIRLVGGILAKTTDAVGLGGVERIAGALFGAIKLAFILLAISFFVKDFVSIENFVSEEMLENSTLYPYYLKGIGLMQNLWDWR